MLHELSMLQHGLSLVMSLTCLPIRLIIQWCKSTWYQLGKRWARVAY